MGPRDRAWPAQATDLKTELAQLRVAKVTGGAASKLAKIGTVPSAAGAARGVRRSHPEDVERRQVARLHGQDCEGVLAFFPPSSSFLCSTLITTGQKKLRCDAMVLPGGASEPEA